MLSRRLTVFALSLVFATRLTLPASSAADPEPLPAGAKLRLGSARMVFPGAHAAVLLPPDYTTYLAPTGVGGYRRFEVATGKPLDPPADPPSGTQMIDVSADGKRAVGAVSGWHTVWNTASGEAVRKLTTPKGVHIAAPSFVPNVSLSFDGSVVAVGGRETGGKAGEQKGVVLVWNGGDEPKRITTPKNTTPIPLLSPDGKTVATWPPMFGSSGFGPDADRMVQVWDVATGAERFQIRAAGMRTTAVAFSPDAALVAASAGEGQIEVFDAKSGKLVTTLLGRFGQGWVLAFSPDGKLFAAASHGGTVQTWSATDWAALQALPPPPLPPRPFVRGLAFAGPGRVVVWGTVGGITPVAWEGFTGKILTPLGEHASSITSIGFRRGGKEILTAGADARVVRWDAATGKPLGTMTIPLPTGVTGSIGLSMTLAPDGNWGAAQMVRGMYDMGTGQELFAYPVHREGSGTNILSRDLSRLAIIAMPNDPKKTGTCAVWNLADRRKIVELAMPAGMRSMPVGSFSPDGTRLVTAATVVPTNWILRPQPPVLRITGWDLATGKKLSEFDHNAGEIVTLVAASNTAAVFYGPKARMRVLDYEAGRMGDEIDKSLPTSPHHPPVFSPDGKRFAVGVYEQNKVAVRLYGWPDGKPEQLLFGHTAPITALTFSADGDVLASGSIDTTVLLWDLTAK